MSREPIDRPEIVVKSFSTAMPFFHARGIGPGAKMLLALASNFRLCGANLYELCSNETIEKILCLSHGQLMRAKRQLRDTGLLNYNGVPGDYTHLRESWERATGMEWDGSL